MAGLDDRLHDEKAAAARSEAQRDRDRVLYSSAFQRLTGITQVASPEIGRGFHTRLIHSVKVAQIARRLAERLLDEAAAGPAHVAQLDPEAVEASALAHDLGHPPFGHLAEEILADCAAIVGGFEGNAQSFRIVSRLSQRDRGYDGLNLTRRVLNGIIKYPKVGSARGGGKFNAYAADEAAFAFAREGWPEGRKSLEAEIMDWADDVTYAVHDMEDFYRAGLVPLDRLSGDQEERARFVDSLFDDGEARTAPSSAFADTGAGPEAIVQGADALFGPFISFRPYDGGLLQRKVLKNQSSFLIGRYMDAFHLNAAQLDEDEPLAVIDQEPLLHVAILKQLTWHYVINRPSLAVVQAGQRRLMRGLFDTFSSAAAEDDLSVFPQLQQDLLRSLETHRERLRLVVDFVAGITEEKALELNQRLHGIPAGNLFEAQPS